MKGVDIDWSVVVSSCYLSLRRTGQVTVPEIRTGTKLARLVLAGLVLAEMLILVTGDVPTSSNGH